MVRRLLRAIAVIAIPIIMSPSLHALTAIVNNNTGAGQAEDTLCVSFFVTDTIGNFTAADSFYVLILSPWGDSAYAAAYNSSAAEIRTVTVGGRKMYRWLESVADIDGVSPRSGTYAGIVVAVDTLDGASSARLDQAFTFSFILEPTLTERARIGDTCNDNKTVTLAAGDSSSLARWVWNTPESNHRVSGTFGRYLDAQISGLSSGSGAYAVDFVVKDSANGQVIPGASIAIRNLDQTALLATGCTDNRGVAGFNLNAAGYVAVTTATGYLFRSLDTIVITGPGTDTLYGYRFDPGSPATPGLCRVYGYVLSVAGKAEKGTMVAACLPSGAVKAGHALVSPFAVSTATDTAGYFALDLLPSDSLSSGNGRYEFTIMRKDGTILRQRVRVPSSASWRLDW